MITPRRVGVAIVMAAVLIGGLAAGRTGWGDGLQPPYSKFEIQQMGRVCGIRPEEEAGLRQMLDEWDGQLRAVDAEWETKRRNQGEARTRDATEKHQREAQRKRTEINTRFQRQIEQYVDRAGEDRWGAFERFLRRARLMPRLGEGADVNVLALAEDFSLTADERHVVTPVLEAYERDLDRALQAAAQQLRESEEVTRETGWDLTNERLLAALQAESDASRAVAKLNRSFAYRAAAVLAPDRGAELRKRFDRAAWPEAYGPFWYSLAIQSATQLDGLDMETRTAVDVLAREWALKDKEYEGEIVAMYREAESGDCRRFEGPEPEWDRIRIERARMGTETVELIRAVIGEDRHAEVLKLADSAVDGRSRARIR